jgi:hypothetical protein
VHADPAIHDSSACIDIARRFRPFASLRVAHSSKQDRKVPLKPPLTLLQVQYAAAAGQLLSVR